MSHVASHTTHPHMSSTAQTWDGPIQGLAVTFLMTWLKSKERFSASEGCWSIPSPTLATPYTERDTIRIMIWTMVTQ